MDVIHEYFRKNHDIQVKLKTQFELLDLETELFYEDLEQDLESVNSQGFLDEYLKILEQEKII